MINVVQGHRTNSVQEAIKYLKGDHDHKGMERKPKPRFLTGSETDCLVACESIDRKHKYVSGTLAFEPTERPTDKQLMEVVKLFRSVFMAGLEHGVNFTDFWNIHEDKGRIELNYVIPLTELTTGKQMNPFPVGRAKEDFKDAFDAYINHQFGYDQIVRDPLKASSSKFEVKVLPHAESALAKQIKSSKPDKDNISQNVAYQVLQGKITSRQELCDYLENFGEITRVNDKFISLKIHGSQKAFRLKGPVYEYGADFKDLRNEALTRGASYKKQLSDADFQKVTDTLKRLTESRRQFNKKLIATPMTGRSNRHRLYGDKAIVKVKPLKVPSEATKTAGTTVKSPDFLKASPHQQAEFRSTQESTKAATTPTKTLSTNPEEKVGSPSVSSSTNGVSDPSIGGLRSQLADLMNQIANAKNPAKAAALKAKATQLENQIGAAVAAERIRKLKEAERFNGMSGKKLKS